MNPIERRDLIKGAAIGALAFTVGGVEVLLTAREARAQNVPFRLLKANEAETTAAASRSSVRVSSTISLTRCARTSFRAGKARADHSST